MKINMDDPVFLNLIQIAEKSIKSHGLFFMAVLGGVTYTVTDPGFRNFEVVAFGMDDLIAPILATDLKKETPVSGKVLKCPHAFVRGSRENQLRYAFVEITNTKLKEQFRKTFCPLWDPFLNGAPKRLFGVCYGDLSNIVCVDGLKTQKEFEHAYMKETLKYFSGRGRNTMNSRACDEMEEALTKILQEENVLKGLPYNESPE